MEIINNQKEFDLNKKYRLGKFKALENLIRLGIWGEDYFHQRENEYWICNTHGISKEQR